MGPYRLQWRISVYEIIIQLKKQTLCPLLLTTYITEVSLDIVHTYPIHEMVMEGFQMGCHVRCKRFPKPAYLGERNYLIIYQPGRRKNSDTPKQQSTRYI